MLWCHRAWQYSLFWSTNTSSGSNLSINWTMAIWKHCWISALFSFFYKTNKIHNLVRLRLSIVYNQTRKRRLKCPALVWVCLLTPLSNVRELREDTIYIQQIPVEIDFCLGHVCFSMLEQERETNSLYLMGLTDKCIDFAYSLSNNYCIY